MLLYYQTLCHLYCAEFRGQLDSAVSVLELVPGVVFTEARDEHQTLSDEERRMRTAKHDSRMKELADTKVKCSLFSLFLTHSLPPYLSQSQSYEYCSVPFQTSHEQSLRPTLGHPSQKEQLDNLCSKEEERYHASLKQTRDHATASKVSTEIIHTSACIPVLLDV